MRPSVRRRHARWLSAGRARLDGRRHECRVDQAGQFELHQDHVDQRRHRRPAGLDDEVRRLPVQRVALARTGRAACAAGRPPAAAAGACRGAGGGTVLRGWSAGRPPCDALVQRAPVGLAQAQCRRRWRARRVGQASSSSMTSCSTSRKRGFAFTLEEARGSSSRCAARSRRRRRRTRSCSCRARCRPTVDLPPPGMPTRRDRGAGESLSSGLTQLVGRDRTELTHVGPAERSLVLASAAASAGTGSDVIVARPSVPETPDAATVISASPSVAKFFGYVICEVGTARQHRSCLQHATDAHVGLARLERPLPLMSSPVSSTPLRFTSSLHARPPVVTLTCQALVPVIADELPLAGRRAGQSTRRCSTSGLARPDESTTCTMNCFM